MLYFSLSLDLDIGSVSIYFYQTYKNYHKCGKGDNSKIHTVIVLDPQSRSTKVSNINETGSKRRTEPTVSGTDDQEGQHVTKPSTSAQAKVSPNLIRTSLRPIIYTPAQLHENDNMLCNI